jgi:hypothetical protein
MERLIFMYLHELIKIFAILSSEPKILLYLYMFGRMTVSDELTL